MFSIRKLKIQLNKYLKLINHMFYFGTKNLREIRVEGKMCFRLCIKENSKKKHKIIV